MNLKNPLQIDKFETSLFSNTDEYKIEPDYLFLKNNKVCLIADAKYMENVKTSSFYQLLTYIEKYSISKAIIIAPLWNNDDKMKRYLLNNKEIIVYRINLTKIKETEKNFIEFLLQFL